MLISCVGTEMLRWFVINYSSLHVIFWHIGTLNWETIPLFIPDMLRRNSLYSFPHFLCLMPTVWPPSSLHRAAVAYRADWQHVEWNIMCFWFAAAAGEFERSLSEKRTAKRGLRDLSWVKEGVWEAEMTFRTSVCLPVLAMWALDLAEQRGKEGRGGGGGGVGEVVGGDLLLHRGQKRKASVGVKRSVFMVWRMSYNAVCSWDWAGTVQTLLPL